MRLPNIKKITSLLLFAIPLLSGCSNNGLSSGDFNIEMTDGIPVAYINEKYDFTKVLTISQGIEYKVYASYYDYTLKAMTNLPVIDYCFTPVSLSDIAIVIEAHNATYIKNKKASVRVKLKGDTIDELLSVGASNYSDPGVSKQINIASQYIKQGNSSISCSYYGNNAYTWGAAVVCPNNFRCLECFSDKIWKNAILTFWVYNPTDYSFEFQLRTQQKNGQGVVVVDTDWGNPINVPQFAAPKAWTQLFFSMNKLGINSPLIQSEDGTKNDSLNIKTKWAGASTTGETYKWQMYIDGLDVVDSSVYPEVDTEKDSSSEVLKDGWENLPLDTTEKSGWGSSKPLYRSTVTRTAEYDSKSSLYLTFADAVPHSIGYSVAFSPEQQKAIDQSFVLPQFSRGTIKADFKFSEDITDHSINCFIVQQIPGDWDTRSIKNLKLTDLGDGWCRLYFDFAKVTAFAGFGDSIRIAFEFNGINDTNKSTAKVYIDNMFFDQNGTGPAPEFVD